jgi:hypothetical protein
LSAIRPVLAHLSRDIGDLTARVLGRRVTVEDLGVTDRTGHLDLDPPNQRTSCNRACRLLQAADGWIALNLARNEDRELLPAWLETNATGAPWDVAEAQVAGHGRAALVERATLLGLPVAAVGETTGETLEAPRLPFGGRVRADRELRVVDMSALWAGPACGAVLAATGAIVVKIESVSRPDPTRFATPRFARQLNGRKLHMALELETPDGQAKLREMVAGADVLITSGRPRAFAALGLSLDTAFADNPGLVWVAVTGYGWTTSAGERVAFGDDAAAAGGLVAWTDGEPRFLGDALADPLTGLIAAVGALKALEAGGGVLVDAALARAAAGAAAYLGLAA